MLWRWERRLEEWRFGRAVRGILDTAPMPVVPGRCTVVSMVGNRDWLMYVVIMKAFYRRIGGGKLVAIVAHDFPRTGQRHIAAHFPGIEFQRLEDIEVGACQRGGTWERLVYLLDRTDRGEYVVQIDCDVMPTGGDIDELVRCIETRTAFTMADHFRIVPLPEAAAFARTLPQGSVGNRAEAALDRLPGAEGLRYVRGSSGLAGFAPGGFPRARIEAFHHAMEKLLGQEDWRGWGTEQCASNFAIANTPGAVTLPFPEYTSFHPGGDRSRAKMFHFIGSFRFDEGVFADLAQREIAALAAGATVRQAA